MTAADEARLTKCFCCCFRSAGDEFDGDVSLLLASLALEGFTMNHKITRPMQLFHADQGQA